MAVTAPKMTIEERDFVQPLKTVAPPGFKPRGIDRLSRYNKPITAASMECSHLLRAPVIDTASGYPTIEYRLWKEAGRRMPPNLQRPDDNYNGSLWRNFRRSYALHSADDVKSVDRKVGEAIALIYPLNVPKPSSLKDHTFFKYVDESDLFRDQNRKIMALHRINDDEKMFRRLKVMSDARSPPISSKGHILPPEGYKKYKPLFLPYEDVTAPPPVEITDDMEPDLFGNLIRKRNRPRLWKLTYRSNNPKYREAMEYKRQLKTAPKLHPPALIRTD